MLQDKTVVYHNLKLLAAYTALRRLNFLKYRREKFQTAATTVG
jgi:hypothetical protein